MMFIMMKCVQSKISQNIDACTSWMKLSMDAAVEIVILNVARRVEGVE